MSQNWEHMCQKLPDYSQLKKCRRDKEWKREIMECQNFTISNLQNVKVELTEKNWPSTNIKSIFTALQMALMGMK